MDPQFHLDLDPEIFDRCEEIRAIASKKWTNASSVSLAKLDQIRTKIYTLGLNDPKSLRPSSCISKQRTESKIDLDDLSTEPPLSTLSYQNTAWGSNQSIPELLRQQVNRNRPVSSNVPSRSRPWSGKRPSTTSSATKPPTGQTRQEIPIAVRGAKYDPKTHRVLTPNNVDSWPSLEDHNDDVFLDLPKAPVSSPDIPDAKNNHQKSSKKSPTLLLRKPTPEPLHLQLPSVGEYADDDDDDDDLDTDRLLEKASVLSNKTGLYGSADSVNLYANVLEEVRAFKRSEVIGKVSEAFGDSNNSNVNSGHSKYSSLNPKEDKLTVIDILPDQPGSRSMSLSSKRSVRNVPSYVSSGLEKNSLNSRSSSIRRSSSESNENSDPLQVSVTRITPRQNGDDPYTPRRTNQLNVDLVSGVNRPKSPITVINIGCADQTSLNGANRGFRAVSAKRQTPGQRPITPVTVVTVDYGEEVEDEDQEDSKENKDLLKTNDLNKSRPSSSQLNHYEQAIKNNTKVYKTTKTLEFAPEGAKESNVRSALPGGTYQLSQPKSVSPETLRKLKSSRPPPCIRKSNKDRPKTPPVEMSTEELMRNLAQEANLLSKKAGAFTKTESVGSFRSKSYTDQQTGVQFIVFKEPVSGNIRTMPIRSGNQAEAKNDGDGASKVSRYKPAFSRIKSAPVRGNNLFSKSKKSSASEKDITMYGSEKNLSTKEKKAREVAADEMLKIVSKNPELEKIESQERRECQYMKEKLARNGLTVAAETLERALYPPSGRTLYYDVPGYLPPTYSSSLLSHPRVWMPENYKRFKEAEKQLERANQMMWLQRREEEQDDPSLKVIKPKPKPKSMVLRKPQTAKRRKKKVKKTLKRSQSFG